MANRLIIQEIDGNIRILLHLSGYLTADQVSRDIPYEKIIEPEELEDLRWYLEDYLQAPFAVWEDRGTRIHKMLPKWGERLFNWLFQSGKARDAYIGLRGHKDFELWIKSDSPDFLALPWELIKDPELPSPMALDGVLINRSIPIPTDTSKHCGGNQLRVLMVIARPYGIEDIPYQMIARSLMEQLDAVSSKVELEVLRPPTLTNLRVRLAQAAQEGKFYDVLHFDGHGAVGEIGDDFSQRSSSTGLYGEHQGFLVFEDTFGKPQPVSAEDVAGILKRANIPLFVLNACHSASLSTNVGPDAAVAPRLLHAGASSVVAMGYSIYAVAAAEFMTVFYETLFDGRSVAEAIAEGRAQMQRNNLRPSPKKKMPLRDWMVPVHYARRDVIFPYLRHETNKGREALLATLNKIRQSAEKKESFEAKDIIDPLRAVGRFFGRDAEFLKLERAIQKNHVAILHGIGGTGKTELAKAFARWMRCSGGLDRSDYVLFHSFEPGLPSFNLNGVLTSIGLKLFGADFIKDSGNEKQRRLEILEILRRHRLLLIWDNFETVHSMAMSNKLTPTSDESESTKIKDFLDQVCQESMSYILITSRSDESWLSTQVYRLKVSGLSSGDAAQYADYLLAHTSAKVQQRREKKSYGELIQFIGGHPLSMRIILPLLEESEPDFILSELNKKDTLTFGFDDPRERTQSLGACIHYSFQHLENENRRCLPLLALFEGVVDVDLLDVLSNVKDIPEPFQGIGKDQWGSILKSCSRMGLLEYLKVNIYRMPPALPGYLKAYWRQKTGTNFEQEWNAARIASIVAYSSFGQWVIDQSRGGDGGLAMEAMDLHHHEMERVLANTLELKAFFQAESILRALCEYYGIRGLYEELRGWISRCHIATEFTKGNQPDFETEAGFLWLTTREEEAKRLQMIGDFNLAADIQNEIIEKLEASDSQSNKGTIADLYHQRGRIAEFRGELSEAEKWYKKSFEIFKKQKSSSGVAINSLRLGILCQMQEDLNGAMTWYWKSKELFEQLNDQSYLAAVYYQLGRVGDILRNFAEAEKWFKKSLNIYVSLKNQTGIAENYFELGRLAHYQGDLYLAEQWYKKALEINETLNNRRHLVTNYGQLGVLAIHLGELEEAMEWTICAATLFDEFPHPFTMGVPDVLVFLTKELGIETLEVIWRRVTGTALPDSVRYIVEQQA